MLTLVKGIDALNYKQGQNSAQGIWSHCLWSWTWESAAAQVKARLHHLWGTYVAVAVQGLDPNGCWLLLVEWMLW